MRPRRGRILALVLAGGAGGRLGVLTQRRAKPALPFGGVYRLIDFPLSNCHASRVSDVWVLQQYNPGELSAHVANGRPWDLDRTYGGLRVVHPSVGSQDEEGWYRGNADALFRNRAEIRAFEADFVLVVSADHVYRLDYRTVVESHAERGADATLVTTRVSREEASRFGTVVADGDGRVGRFAYKPEEPETDVVTTEVFVYTASTLLAALDELGEADTDGAGLDDFGDELIPRLVRDGAVFAYPHEGYWRDVGTIESYWQAHMDLVGDDPPIRLDDPGWPILTRAHARAPARIDGGRLESSLVSPGTVVEGDVSRSVLGPGVRIGRGAEVRDSILFEDVEIGPGAVVERAIVDARERVEREAHVGCPAEITVVGEEQPS